MHSAVVFFLAVTLVSAGCDDQALSLTGPGTVEDVSADVGDVSTDVGDASTDVEDLSAASDGDVRRPDEDGHAQPPDVALDGSPSDDADGGPSPSGWAPLAWEHCEGGGRVLEAGPDDYRDVLGTLEPGDTLRLMPGDYTRGLPVRASGEEGRCIVIEGVPGMDRPVIRGSSSFNLISLRDVSWVKVRGIDIQGDGGAGFGVASEGGESGYAHHIVIEGLHMTGLGSNQQVVGISTKTTCWDWVIRGNTIMGAGTGMYLGNSRGGAPFIRGVIEFNLILDTIGYNMQIKHQTGRPDVPGMPTGQSDTVIRYNVFSKENGASGGGDARPNFLLGHFPTSGSGETDRYLVYGNFFHENPNENLVQAEGNVVFYNNVLVNRSGGAAVFRPHNDVPRDVDVFFNTVIAAGRPIDIRGGDPEFTQRARYNVVFAGEGIRADNATDNIEGSIGDADGVLGDASGELGRLDLHPLPGVLGGAPNLTELSVYLDAAVDFDGRERDGSRLGAYRGPADDMSWTLERTARPYGD